MQFDVAQMRKLQGRSIVNASWLCLKCKGEYFGIHNLIQSKLKLHSSAEKVEKNFEPEFSVFHAETVN